MGKKRGRKPIGGERQSFVCPPELYDYVEKFGRENGQKDWSVSIRLVITDHMKLKRRRTINYDQVQ